MPPSCSHHNSLSFGSYLNNSRALMRSFAHNLVEGQNCLITTVYIFVPPPSTLHFTPFVVEANCMQLNIVEGKSRFANKQQHHKKFYYTQHTILNIIKTTTMAILSFLHLISLHSTLHNFPIFRLAWVWKDLCEN